MKNFILILCILGIVKISSAQTYLPLTGGTLTGGLTGTTATFSGLITSTVSINAIVAAIASTTNPKYVILTNDGSSFLSGMEGSSGGFLIAGNPAYYGAIVGGAGLGISANNGNNVHYSINSVGNHDFKSGTATFGGTVSGTSASFNNIGIGTSTIPFGYKLAVDGNIIAEAVKVQLSGSWPDYIFHKNYFLKPLSEVEQYIRANEHLPEMPSAEEVKKEGINLGEMNAKLLQKIEELTLYLIEKDKQVTDLQERMKMVEGRKYRNKKSIP